MTTESEEMKMLKDELNKVYSDIEQISGKSRTLMDQNSNLKKNALEYQKTVARLEEELETSEFDLSEIKRKVDLCTENLKMVRVVYTELSEENKALKVYLFSKISQRKIS